jgi:hypothetical protein
MSNDDMTDDEIRGAVFRMETMSSIAKKANEARLRVKTLEAAIREHRNAMDTEWIGIRNRERCEKLWSHLPEDDTQ